MVVVNMAVTTGVDDDEDGVEQGTGVNTGVEFVVVTLLFSVDTGELLMAMTGRLGLPTDTAKVTGDRKLLFELLLTIL